MKKHYGYGIVVFLIVVMVFFVVASHAAGSPSDIKNHQYRESIQYLYDHNVVKGYADGTFGPDRAVNRAEILKIILESSSPNAIGSGSDCFPDVKEEWFARYICYAKEHAIVKGYADGTFKPSQQVTIAEALKMSLETFAVSLDKSSSVRYQPYIEFVHNNSIFSKYALLPSNLMTRGQMAYLIHQLMLEKEGTKAFTNIRDVNKSLGCGKESPTI